MFEDGSLTVQCVEKNVVIQWELDDGNNLCNIINWCSTWYSNADVCMIKMNLVPKISKYFTNFEILKHTRQLTISNKKSVFISLHDKCVQMWILWIVSIMRVLAVQSMHCIIIENATVWTLQLVQSEDLLWVTSKREKKCCCCCYYCVILWNHLMRVDHSQRSWWFSLFFHFGYHRIRSA